MPITSDMHVDRRNSRARQVMQLTRRGLIQLATSYFSIAQPTQLFAQSTSDLPLPPEENFESGDFLWPKRPGAYVPYSGVANGSFEEDERSWTEDRDAFVERQLHMPRGISQAALSELKNMTYREFHARYTGDQRPNMPGVYGSGSGIYVGHVSILDIDSSGIAWVIEAMPESGVTRVRYDDWIKGRPEQVVWHGRLKGKAKSDREKISAEARKYIGRGYDFWNFHLDDDSGFYCSKLVWLSVWRSLSFPIDGNKNPERSFWLSPKQILYAAAVDRLYDPGDYANL